MFLGEFEHTIDDKNRVVIPSKFRDRLKDPGDREGFYVIANPNVEVHCLRLYTATGWAEVVEGLREQARQSDQPDRLFRWYASRGELVPLDSQGRVVIPQKIMDLVGLSKNVIMVGNFDWIELWNVDEYKSESEHLKPPVDPKSALWPKKR